jgi:hypothetical protein
MPMEIAYSHRVSIIRTLVHERPFSPSTTLAWSVNAERSSVSTALDNSRAR